MPRLTLKELKGIGTKLERGYARERAGQYEKQLRKVRARMRDTEYFDQAACWIPDLLNVVVDDQETARDDNVDMGGREADEDPRMSSLMGRLARANAVKAKKHTHKKKAGKIMRRWAAQLY